MVFSKSVKLMDQVGMRLLRRDDIPFSGRIKLHSRFCDKEGRLAFSHLMPPPSEL